MFFCGPARCVDIAYGVGLALDLALVTALVAGFNVVGIAADSSLKVICCVSGLSFFFLVALQATLSFFKKTTPNPKPSSKVAQNAAPKASPAKKPAATRSSPRAKAPVAASPLRRSPRKRKHNQPEDDGIAAPTACAETKGDVEDRSTDEATNASEPAAAAPATTASTASHSVEHSEAAEPADGAIPSTDAGSGSDSDSSSDSSGDDSSSDDDSDDEEEAGNGLAPELQALIDAKMKAMQAQYRSFDKQQRQQKLDDLMAAVDGLKQEEAELALDMCDKNEIAAAERIMGDQDFLKNIRDMLEQRQRDADRAELRRRRVINRENASRNPQTRRRNKDDDEPGAVSVVVDDGTAIKIVGEGKDVQKKKASARPRPEGLSLSAALRKLAKLKEAKAKSSATASPASRGTSPLNDAAQIPDAASPAATETAAEQPATRSSPRSRGSAATATTAGKKTSGKASPAKATSVRGSPRARTASPSASPTKPLSPVKARRGKSAEKKTNDTTPSRRSGRVRKPRQFLASEQAQELAEAAAILPAASPQKQPKPRASPKKRTKSAALPAKAGVDTDETAAAQKDPEASESNTSKEQEIELTADDLRAIGWSEARIKVSEA